MKNVFLIIAKFLMFLLLLPLIAAFIMGLQSQLIFLPFIKVIWLLWGAGVYTLIHLFIYRFEHIFNFGYQAATSLFRFLGPVANIAGLSVPVYAILVAAIAMILNAIGYLKPYEMYVIFALGFFLALHIVGAAHQMYQEDTSPIKSEYFFNYGISLIVILIIFAIILIPILPEFSFLKFSKEVADKIYGNYLYIYKFLFVPKN